MKIILSITCLLFYGFISFVFGLSGLILAWFLEKGLAVSVDYPVFYWTAVLLYALFGLKDHLRVIVKVYKDHVEKEGLE